MNPYAAYRFRLTWAGRTVAGFSEASGLPNAGDRPTVTLTRGVTHDAEFEQWARQSAASRGTTGARRDVIVEVYDEVGAVAHRHTVVRCWASHATTLSGGEREASTTLLERLTLTTDAPDAAPDLLDRLLGHDAWTTGRALDFVAALPDEQLDQDFDVGHGTIRETLRHMVGNIEVWTDLMAERPVREGREGPQSAAELRQRFEAAYAGFGEVARAARDGGRLNETYPDVLDEPPRQKSFGGTILHVITHNHQHRAELLHMLARQGAAGLIEGDVLSWEAQAEDGDDPH